MLRRSYSGKFVKFSIGGDVNLADIADFLREMTKEIMSGSRAFLLDISSAEHIQRHAFDSLINIKNKLRAGGVRLVIVCDRQALLDILNVERIPEHFEVLRDPSSLTQDYVCVNGVRGYRN